MKLDEFNANQANNDKIIKGREFGNVPNDEFRFFSDNVVNNKDGLNSRKVENDENKGEKVEGEVQGEKRQKDEFSKDEVKKAAKSSNQGSNSSSSSSSSSSSGEVASSTSAATSASAVTTSVATAASVVAVASVSIAAGVSVITGLNVKCDLKEFLMFTNRVEYNLMLDAESDGPLDDITQKYIINVYNDNYEKSNELHFGENRGEFTNLTNGQKYNLVVKEDSDLGGTLLERVFTLDFPDEISEFKGLIFDKTANFDDNTFVISLDYIDEKNIFSDFEFYLEETNTQKSYTYVLEKTTEKQTLSTFDLSKNIDFNIESGTFKYKLSYKENGEVITSESEPFTFTNNVPPKEKIYASFNPNGGSGTMEDIEITEEGIYLPECSFTYEGYEFIGWTIKDSGDDLLPVGQHLSSSISVELLAHWQEIQPITTYIVSFNSNGGTGSMESAEVTDSDYTLPECSFTKENYEFIGWLVNEKIKQAGETIQINEDIELIAQWEEVSPQITTYVVSFDSNGGTGSMKSIETLEGYYTLPQCDFTYENHSFAGWVVDGITIDVGEEIYVDKDTIIIASWTKDEPISETFMVSFNANGGTGSMAPIEDISGEYNLPEPDFFYEGYDFVGWKINNEGNILEVETSIDVNEDIVLYAQWSESIPAPYTVSFNSNGGTGSMTSISDVTSPYELPSCDFTYENYEFAGWKIDNKGEAYASGVEIELTSDIELYAQWERIPAITAFGFGSNLDVDNQSFDAYMSISGDTSRISNVMLEIGTATQKVEVEIEAKTSQNVTILNLSDVFLNAQEEYEYKVTYDVDGVEATSLTGYVTFKAKPVAYFDGFSINEYADFDNQTIDVTLSYSGTASLLSDFSLLLRDCETKQELTKPLNLTTNEQTVSFLDSTLSDPFIVINHSYEAIVTYTNDSSQEEFASPDPITFISEAQDTFSVGFNSNGGSGDMSPLENVSGEIPVPSCDYIYDGYEFAGWKVNNEGDLITLEDTLVVNDDIVLYAQWTSSEPTDASISEVVYSSEANFDNQIIYITLVYSGDEDTIDNLGLTLTNNTTNESRYASVEKTPEIQPVSFYDQDNPATFINGEDSYTCVLSYEINGVAGSLENESLVTFIDPEHQSDPAATLNNVIINSDANFTDKKISLTLQYENYGSSDLNDFFLNITNVTKQESYQVALTATTVEQDVQLDSTFPLNNKDDYSYVITYMNADGEQSYSSDEYIQFIDPSYIESLVNGVTISPDMNFKEGNFTLVLDYVQGNETISDVKLTLKDVNDQNKTATFNLNVISSDQSFNLYEHNLDASTSYTYTLTYMIDGYPGLLESEQFSFVDTYVSSATVDSITFVNNGIDLSTGIFSFVVNGQDPDGDISNIVLTMSQGDNIQQFEITSLNETHELKFEDPTSGNFTYSLTYINYNEESQINGEISLNDTQQFTWGGVTFGNELVDIDNGTMPLRLDYTGDIAQQYSSLTLYISEPTGGDAIPFDLALTKDEQSVLIGSANVSYGYGYSYHVTIKGTKIDGTGEDDLYTGDMSFIRQSSVSGFSLTSENISDNNYGFEYNLTIIDDANQYSESPKIVIRTSQNVDYVYECEAYYGSTGGPFTIYINNFENSDGQTTGEELISEFQDVTILFSYYDNASGETIYIVLEKGVTFY